MSRYIKLNIFLIFFCTAAPMFYSRAASAEELKKSQASYNLGEIVISGKTAGVQASESVYTVTSKDIEDMDARTLDQAIELLPGVNVRTAAQGIPRIDIRGFRTRHVTLLLDGIPINSAFDGQFDPTTIPTNNIARIKMTAGASSILYGQGGLGGVINIITKKGSKGIKGVISGETGDHERYIGRASVSGSKDKVNFFVSGNVSKIDSYPLSDDFTPTSEQPAGYRLNSDSLRNNVFANVGYSPNDDLTLGLTFNYIQGNFGKPGSIINDPLDPFAAPPKYERIEGYDGYSAQLAADYQVTDAFSFRGWGFINQLDQDDTQFDNANFDSINLVPGSFREHIRTIIGGASLQPKYEFGKAGTVTLALSAERDYWKNNGQINLAVNTLSPVDISKAFNIYSAGVEYEINPIDELGLVVGYGHYWQTRNEMSEDGYSLLAGAYYDVLRDTRLKASFKRNIRFPALGDLYRPNQGNPDLVAEHAYTYEGGVEQKLPLNSKAGITGFYTIAKNLIQNDQTVGQNENLPEIDFVGFELSAATQFVKNLLLRLSYTYMDSKDKSRAGRDQQQYTPGDKVAAEAKYDFDFGFTPYVSVLYVGHQYFYTRNGAAVVAKLRLQDYMLVNVKLNQKILDDKVNLYIGVNNIFDENYETSYGFPQTGRFLYGGVEFLLGT